MSALARAFFTEQVLPCEEAHARQGYPDPVWYRRAGDVGLLGSSIPESYGGGGGDFGHLALVVDEQIRAGVTSLGIAITEGIVAHYLLAYATDAQRRRWLPRLCSGEWVGSIAMTEPGTGSDLQAITTRARLDGDHYVISGAKTFITNGWLCNLLIIAARTGTEPGAAGISLLVAEVDDTTPGFRRGRILKKLGNTGQDTAELFFDELRVPVVNILGGAEGLGFAQLMQQLPQERLLTAIIAQAMIEAAVEVTVEYTKARNAFGKPLFAMQNTRFELAECATIARIGRCFLDECTNTHRERGLDAVSASMAKYWITDRASEVIDRCQQLFGGYGYCMEYPIAAMYADNRVLRVLAGANEVMKELIARSL